MAIKIKCIDDEPALLEQVITLADRNRSTLGFLPKKAFEDYARQKQILVAIDAKNQVMGYLWYRISSKKYTVAINHLCVSEDHRKNGVAKQLVDKLKDITSGKYFSIEVRSRRDFESHKIWPKLGFIALTEMPGKSKGGSILTVYRYKNRVLDLFSLIDENVSPCKYRAVIDANIVFSLQEQENEYDDECTLLLSNWLEDNIILCVTQEIFNEIDRNQDAAKRIITKSFAQKNFEVLDCFGDNEAVLSELRTYFQEELTESDWSDLRQLAHAVANNADYFITKDSGLLEISEVVFDNHELKIIQPIDLLIEQDALLRQAEYRSARFYGSRIEFSKVKSGESIILEKEFRNSDCETKASFMREIKEVLGDPQNISNNLVRDCGNLIGFFSVKHDKDGEIEVPYIRIKSNFKLRDVLAKQIVNFIITESIERKKVVIRVLDSPVSDEIARALKEYGFFILNHEWIKINLSFIGDVKHFSMFCKSQLSKHSDVSDFIAPIAKKISDGADELSQTELIEIEKTFFPLKFTNEKISTFVVPILPKWAMHLFDRHLADQDLFGSRPELIFNVENVYYRSARPNVLVAPARIIWYVTVNNKYQGTGILRACSYLNEIIVGRPKKLFSSFKRLGVYEWKEIFELSENDLEKEIMAFRFSHTELFANPMSLSEAQNLWKTETGKSLVVQGPCSVSGPLFEEIYKRCVFKKQ